MISLYVSYPYPDSLNDFLPIYQVLQNALQACPAFACIFDYTFFFAKGKVWTKKRLF